MSSDFTSMACGPHFSETTGDRNPKVIFRRRRAEAFSRDGDRIHVLLESDERELVAELARQFHSVVAADEDPDLTRLYPIAYVGDCARQTDYADLVHEDLVRTRLEAADTVVITSQSDSLDDGQLDAWMQVLNGLRLLLGTRLDISEEDGFDPEAVDAPQRALLAWLGFLLEEAVGAASDR
ncbi:MAG: hypothetical protein CL467_01125 [Acidimicrobiaceae bacterium]|nr:hypothetical protein [Acidimicrobiaceae bacterium]